MYYSQENNLLMCLINSKLTGADRQCFLPRFNEYQRLLVERANFQQNLHLHNQLCALQLAPIRFQANQNNSLEAQRRNQKIRELQKLKNLLEKIGEAQPWKLELLQLEVTNAAARCQIPARETAMPASYSPAVRDNAALQLPTTNFQVFVNNQHGSEQEITPSITELDMEKNEEEEGKLPSLRPCTPCSDVSSGLGTMPSPISDLDSPPILSSPQSNLNLASLKQDNDGDTDSETGSQAPTTFSPPKDNIKYQGRNLLDLYTNLTYQWSFQMAVLPPHDLVTHFQYRSLYHRLGPYGMIDELANEKCSDCDFEFVVPKY